MASTSSTTTRLTPSTPNRPNRPAGARSGVSTKKPGLRAATSEAEEESRSSSVFDIPSGYRKLLDAFDAVRRLDKTTELDLPTLVVSGKTSAGKSSVLEAITTLNFPRASGRCTRYATVVSMRREDKVSIRLYTTGSGSSTSEFERTLEGEESLSEIHDIILYDVAEHFGIKSDDDSGTFSEGVLNIDYHGPKLPLLTVVDTPGFVSVDNSPQEAALVKNIVHRYINREKKHTIVLSIISANDATDNQAILGIMEDLDPKHERTLGIITKPDQALGDRDVLKLARNEHPKWKMKYAWHVLRNHNTVDGDIDLQSRNAQEKTFFSDERNGWKDFSWEQKGIDSLVTRLQRLLYEQAKRAMRPVLTHLRGELKDLSSEVTTLEEYFRSIANRRKEFLVACRNLASIALLGINGSYKHPYFRRGTNQNRRLRHTVRRMSSKFTVQIRGIHGPPVIHEEDQDRSFHDSGIGTPAIDPVEISPHLVTASVDNVVPCEVVSTALPLWDSETLDNLDERWKKEIMKQLLDNSQGEELSGDVDPQRLNLLFWDISEKWQAMAEQHVKSVHELSIEFIHLVIDDWELRPDGESTFLEPETDAKEKLKNHLEESFARRLHAALKELQKIEGDRLRASRTTDPTIGEKARSLKWKRLLEMLNSYVKVDNASELTAAKHARVAKLDDEREKQGEDFLDKCLLYYHSALTRYQDNVAVQVVERHILDGLEKSLRDVDVLIGEAAIDHILTAENEEEKKAHLVERKERLDQYVKCEKELKDAI